MPPLLRARRTGALRAAATPHEPGACLLSLSDCICLCSPDAQPEIYLGIIPIGGYLPPRFTS